MIKIQIKFNLNKWLESRMARREEKFRNICPHSRIIDHLIEGKIKLESCFALVSQSQIRCSRCGLVTSDLMMRERATNYWASNPELLVEREKKFVKLARKLGKI